MIASINNAHAKAFAGQPKMFTPTDIPIRRKISQDGVTARLEELNAELAATGVRFDLGAGQVHTNQTTELIPTHFRQSLHWTLIPNPS
jgi:hypothetical protein